MTTPYKLCPRCRTAAPLTAAQCARCGHVYRTQFTGPSAQATYQSTTTAPPRSAAPTMPPYDYRAQARASICRRRTRTAFLCVAGVLCFAWAVSVASLWNSQFLQLWGIGLMPQNWGAAGPEGAKAQALLPWVLVGLAAILLALLWGVASLIHTACSRITEATNVARAERLTRTQIDPASLAWHERYRTLLIAAVFAVFLIANNPTEDDLVRWASAQPAPEKQTPSAASSQAGDALGTALATPIIRAITTRYNLVLGSVFVVRLNGGGGVFLGAAHEIVPLWRAPATPSPGSG